MGKYWVSRCQFQKRINCSISYFIYLSDILRNKKTAKEKNVGGRKKIIIIIIIIRTKTIGLSSERLKDLIIGKNWSCRSYPLIELIAHKLHSFVSGG